MISSLVILIGMFIAIFLTLWMGSKLERRQYTKDW